MSYTDFGGEEGQVQLPGDVTVLRLVSPPPGLCSWCPDPAAGVVLWDDGTDGTGESIYALYGCLPCLPHLVSHVRHAYRPTLIQVELPEGNPCPPPP